MFSQSTINWLRVPLLLPLILQLDSGSTAELLASNVEKWANILGEHLREMFGDATKENEIIAMYRNYGEVEIFDPRIELKKAKGAIEAYLKRRAKAAWDAKVSLESRDIANLTEQDVNDPMNANFIRFMAAKQETDSARVHAHDHSGNVLEVNSTRQFNLTPNANFYGIPTSSLSSAVHIPTPVYDRNPEVLLKVDWSDIDHLYRANRDETRDLAFQMFCSESGFMRFYPAISWVWDNREDKLDLFDCRSTEWYINAATLSKNVIIMLDMSGSMLGQRFEIAKQTVEAILETLSDNDFFNILPFSKTVGFLDECSERAGLLQATVRNKKMLRARLNGLSSEGKAEYEKGLIKAFETLMKMRNYTGKKAQFGCNDVIMLITDGAPNYFKQIFRLYNKNKSVRFFSFLIGEEATDVAQVKWMACDNKGFMVHISNLADVQEKVQHYIKVMSRPVGKQGGSFGEKDAIWSGVYKERLLTTSQKPVKKKSRIKRVDARTEMLVTTVSYPVIQDKELMGVAAVNVPVIELEQLVHTANLGSRSYTFMLNNNGYVMFHPQMRLLDPEMKQMKLNYNNIDILELEVPQNQQLLNGHLSVRDRLQYDTSEMRGSMISCDNAGSHALDVLFATDNLERVYRQSNTYYSECLKQSFFTVGIAVAKGDEKRIKPRKEMNYGDVKLLWYDTPNWLMHPVWRYCLLNDSDAKLTPEAAFRVYVRQMRAGGRLPKLCEYRKPLVDRFLFDMKVTNGLTNLWDVNWKQNKKKQIHLVWFATASGMIKYWDELPDGMTNVNPNWPPSTASGTVQLPKPATATATAQAIPPQQIRYQHFIKDLNRRSSEDQYFRRSVRMPRRLVVGVNKKTHLWYQKETQSMYGHPENVSLLLTATKALDFDGAPIGVVGMEFTLDYMAEVMKKLGCGPQDERRWCLLLDEHAYIVYSSLNISVSSSSYGFSGDEIGIPKNFNLLGHWFGTVNRITERTMALLLKNNYYTETTYVDYQAICKQSEMVMYTAGAAVRVSAIVKSLLWLWNRLWTLLQDFTIIQIFTSILHPHVAAYTATFTGDTDTFSCDKAARYYLANWGVEDWSSSGPGQKMPTSSALIADNLAERPCKHNPAKCAVKMYAQWVPGTNLLLVVISQSNPAASSSACYDETQCPLSVPPEFKTTYSQVDNASDKQQVVSSSANPFSDDISDRRCRHVRAKQRKSPSKCIHSNEDESQYPCSQTASRLVPFSTKTLVLFAVTYGAVLVTLYPV